MPDAKDYSPDGKDREEWDRGWSSMPHRHLAKWSKFELWDPRGHLGEPISITISQDPPQFADWVKRGSEPCPVCGEPTSATDRLAATLSPRWANGVRFGIGVWIHRICFESLPDVGGPAPIPW